MHTDDDDGDEMSSPREETSTVDDLAKAAGVESRMGQEYTIGNDGVVVVGGGRPTHRVSMQYGAGNA